MDTSARTRDRCEHQLSDPNGIMQRDCLGLRQSGIVQQCKRSPPEPGQPSHRCSEARCEHPADRPQTQPTTVFSFSAPPSSQSPLVHVLTVRPERYCSQKSCQESCVSAHYIFSPALVRQRPQLSRRNLHRVRAQPSPISYAQANPEVFEFGSGHEVVRLPLGCTLAVVKVDEYLVRADLGVRHPGREPEHGPHVSAG